ncbi:hypothetical protein KC851_03185 [Candidatus Kaiserbacteria bacterium]|nr:hypothetical protein [Candidatus Kaiserbacteria bacterium]
MPDISKPKVRTKIRTYAGDLELQKQQQGITKSTDTTAVKKAAAPIPKAETPKQFTEAEKTTDPISSTAKKEKSFEPVPVMSAPKSLPEIHQKPKQPTKIPSFHELNKQIETIESTKGEKKTHKSISTKKSHGTGGTTIITDTKRKRFRLFPSIVAAFKGWLKEKARKKKTAPKYTVTDTTTRKGIIQEATSKTGSVFTADSDTLRERIRQRRAQEKLASSPSPESEDEPDIDWSPFTEPGYDLLPEGHPEEKVIKNVKVEFRKPFGQIPTSETYEIPTTSDPKETEEDASDLDELRWSNVTDESEKEPDNLTISTPNEEPLQPIPPTIPEPVSTSEPETPPEPEPIKEIAPTVNTPETKTSPKPKGSTNRHPLIDTVDTNTLTVIVLSIIIGLVMLIFIARIIINYFDTPNLPVSQDTPTAIHMLPDVERKSVTLNNPEEPAIEESLCELISTTNTLAEITVLDKSGNELSPALLFNLLEFETRATFRQSLTKVHFIATGHSQPALLMSYTDETAIQGGLLAWEPYLADNLSTIYQLSTSEEMLFTDKVIMGVDTRALYSGDELVLLYAILDNNRAVIAPNEAAFGQILNTTFVD